VLNLLGFLYVSCKLPVMPYYFRLPLITDLTVNQQAALNETDAISISGGPGTGKSVVSLWRHIRNYDLGTRRSLLLTYTKTLERYLTASASSENIEAGNAIDRTMRWTWGNRQANYDEIIVDEAQDVESAKYDIIKSHAKIVSIGADDQQIVYPDHCTNETQLATIFSNNMRHELFENFRNSYEIMQFVRSLFPNRLIPQATINSLFQAGRRGNKPILLITKYNDTKQSRAIVDIVNQFRADTHNMAILVPLQNHVDTYCKVLIAAGIQCSRFSNEDGYLGEIDNVHVTTFKSAKGTEFDTVIIPDFEDMLNNIARLRVIEESDYYVAVTRARRNLYLISSSTLPYINQTTIQQENL
jgi:superfamily I DNA/RNA helicase